MSSPLNKFKVLVTHPEVPEAAINILKEKCSVTVCEELPPKRSELLLKCKDVDGILWATHEKLNAEALDIAGANLKSVSTMSAGLDHVDILELRRRGIPLGHTPMVLNEAVADVAIGLMIAACRRFHEGRMKIETASWENWHVQWMLGQEIAGSTVGFLGFGNIGEVIAKRLQGFDVGKIIYHNRKAKPNADKFNAKFVSFDELLSGSDILIIACPLTAETKGIINKSAFSKMKSNCILVNIARGPIVNQDDLYDALKNNKIFAAGLDVTTPEPLPKDDKLLSLPNCVIIPHLGSATFKTREQMAVVAARNVLNGLEGRDMVYPAK